MKITRIMLTLTALVLTFACVRAVAAQCVQPIVLTQSPDCCENPASLASTPVPLPCGDRTYLLPEDRDPLRVISTTSRLVPLPTPQTWRGYDTHVQPASGCSVSQTRCIPSSPLPPAPVQVLRPVTVAPPSVAVPEGYVVGKGLIGQPKLYKPGQPIRNFLRYITL